MTQINDFLKAADNFVSSINPHLVKVKVTRYNHNPILANNFNKSYKTLNPIGGVYLFVVPESSVVLEPGEVLYVGQSTNIWGRFLQHIGTGFKFGKHPVCFPDFGLAAMYHWANLHKREILRRGNFEVYVLGIDPIEMRWIFESFLIAYGRSTYGKPPEFNVNG